MKQRESLITIFSKDISSPSKSREEKNKRNKENYHKKKVLKGVEPGNDLRGMNNGLRS